MKLLQRIISISLVLVLCFSVLAVTGCDEEQNEGYNIYYKNEDGNMLVSAGYNTETTATLKLAEEFVDKLRNVGDKKEYVSIFPDELKVEKIEYKEPIISIYFDSAYNEMTSEAELMLRAGLVKTLAQINGVTHIQFYVDDVPAQYSDGTNIGLLDAADFVDDSAQGMDSIQWTSVELYYCNERGDKLVKYKEDMAYSKNASLERMVVEKLIKGPTDKNMQATVPSTIKLLDISLNDRVCYVNLDASFLTEMVNVSAEIPVYSIVNTLCSLPGIDSVRILINGDMTKVYREVVKLDTDLKFNYEIVDNQTTNSLYVK